jgi:uncharacterized protein
MPRVVHFEISADDPARASAFYSNVFGWKFDKWDGPMEYWLITTGPDGQPGINGGLTKRQSPQPPQPSQPCTTTIDVPSVDEYAGMITKNGGKILMPKDTIPGVGYFIYCQDTEGTAFGIMQFDAAAK